MNITTTPRKLALALASSALLTLAGCGGGTSAPPASATTGVPVTVIDDAIRNATVCLDKNLNGMCDNGEPSGRTDAAGNVTLQVATADAGKYPILAVVGTDAVDVKYGPITTPFTMQAPADKPAVVSPLTTLVQTLIATTGATSAQAEASVKAQTGINISLFEDFSKGTTADSQAAGTVARMVVVTTQQQSSTLSSTVGTTAIDGAKITQADLDKIIQNKLLEILPALLTALADPSVQSATDDARDAALLAQAKALVASTGLTTASVATLVAINNQIASSPAAGADTPVASASLRALNFTNSSNWSARVIVSTLAQNTLDAAGKVRYVIRRSNSVNGAQARWNYGGQPARQSDLHFNGSTWVSCGLNSENTSTVRDAKGNSSYEDCDKLETGSSSRASFDISGRPMIDIYNQIRAAGYTNLSISSAASALSATTFPTGSKLFYQSNTPLSTAIAYYPGSGNLVTQYSAAINAGGSNNPACSSTEFSGPGTNSTTLEGLISALPGTPCVSPSRSFTYVGVTYTSPDSPSEAWGNSTVSLGTIGTAPVNTGSAPGFYSGNTRLRVAFKGPGTNPVTYYACKEQFNNGSARNCTVIGTGSYTIATLGDARVLTLSNPPPITSGLGSQRVFVERGGKVYFGYQSHTTTTNSARLNLAGTNALLTQLALPAVDPDTPLALTRTSYAGDWEVFDTAEPTVSHIISLFNDGTTICKPYANGTPGAPFACTLTFTDLANGSFTMTDSEGGSTNTSTAAFNFLSGAASGTYVEVNPAKTGSFTGARR